MVNRQYKLTYFDARGKGELIRLLFAYKDVKYEDVRIQIEDWPIYKPKQPFGQLPVLEVDGVLIAQSVSIARFIAREFGLAGKDNIEAARCDMLIDGITDLFTIFSKYLYISEKDPVKRESMKTSAFQMIPGMLDNYGKQLKGKFFTGDSITWADIGFMCAFDELLSIEGSLLDKHPKLKNLYTTVKAQPNIKNHIANRPVTDF